MTGRKQVQRGKRVRVTPQQVESQQNRPRIQQDQTSQTSQSSQSSQASAQPDESASIVQQQPTRKDPLQQVTKKIIKAEIDESRTLKHVFKSNPDSQMKEFIKKAAKPQQPASKALPKTPAEAHPPAVAQELLETDDDVADNLGKLFKASKSYKNS